MITTPKVLVSKIRFDDFRFSVWAFSDYSSITESIKEIGLIHAPVVVKGKGGRFSIASGQKRLRACKELDLDEVNCEVIPSPQDDYQLLFHMVLENLSFRDYNLVEKSMIYNRLRKSGLRGKPMENICRKLGINRRNALSISKLENLSRRGREAICCGKLKGKAVLEMVNLALEDQKEYLKLIEKADFSHSRQSIVLGLLVDIAARTGKSFHNILHNRELSREVERSRKAGLPITPIIHNWLINHRLPALARHRREFEELRKKAKFPQFVRISGNQDFEGDSLDFVVSVKKARDLRDAGKFFGDLADKPGIQRFIDSGIGVCGDLGDDGEDLK